jgi:hypothetical protein
VNRRPPQLVHVATALGIVAGSIVAVFAGAKELSEALHGLIAEPILYVVGANVLFVLAATYLLCIGGALLPPVKMITRPIARRSAKVLLLLLVLEAVTAGGLAIMREGSQQSKELAQYRHDLHVLASTKVELHASETSPLNDSRAVEDRLNRLQGALQRVVSSGALIRLTSSELRSDLASQDHDLHLEVHVDDVAVVGRHDRIRIVRWIQKGPRRCLFDDRHCGSWPGDDRGGFVISDEGGPARGILGCNLHPTDTRAFASDDGATTVLFAGNLANEGAASGDSYVNLVRIAPHGLILDQNACPGASAIRQRFLDNNRGYAGGTGATMEVLRELWLDNVVPFIECHACEHLREHATYKWDSAEGQFILVDRRIDETPYAFFVRLVRSFPFGDDAEAKRYLASTVDVATTAAFLNEAVQKKCAAEPSDAVDLVFDCNDWIYQTRLRRSGRSWQLVHITASKAPLERTLTFKEMPSPRPPSIWPTPDPYEPLLVHVPGP